MDEEQKAVYKQYQKDLNKRLEMEIDEEDEPLRIMNSEEQQDYKNFLTEPRPPWQMNSEEQQAYNDFLTETQEPRKPQRIRPISPNVSNQFKYETCYAHSIARMIVRFFYTPIHENLDEELVNPDDECQKAIINIQLNTFLDNKCSGVNRTKTQLYRLIYYYLIRNRGPCIGAYTAQELIDAVEFINSLTKNVNINNIKDQVDANIKKKLTNYNMSKSDIHELYLETFGNGPIMAYGCPDLKTLNEVITVGNYLIYNVDAQQCKVMMIKKKRIIHSRNYNHVITIVTKKGEWFGAKNSWGDPRLLWMHEDDIILENVYFVGYKLTGGNVKVSGRTRKFCKSHKSKRQRKTKKTRQRKSRNHRRK